MLLPRLVAADDQQHFRRAFGEKHRGLARRVAAAGDDHGRVAAELPFLRRRRVVDARALEASRGLRPPADCNPPRWR